MTIAKEVFSALDGCGWFPCQKKMVVGVLVASIAIASADIYKFIIFTWKNRISRDELCPMSRTDPMYQVPMNREEVSLGRSSRATLLVVIRSRYSIRHRVQLVCKPVVAPSLDTRVFDPLPNTSSVGG